MKNFLGFFLTLVSLSIPAMAAVHKDKSHTSLKDISIIVPSTDKYSELWDVHFNFLFKHWSNLLNKDKSVPIFLVSNFKEYNHERIHNLKIGADRSWSDGFLTGLASVKTKYVLILFEDYIMTHDVNEERLISMIDLLERTNGAYAGLTLSSGFNDGEKLSTPKDVIIRDHFGEYRTSLQACIWNVEDLKWLLKPNESAWSFEIEGTVRSQGMTKPFYMITADPVFTYLNASSKGKYEKSVITYINSQGVSFTPSSEIIHDDTSISSSVSRWFKKKLRKMCKYSSK